MWGIRKAHGYFSAPRQLDLVPQLLQHPGDLLALLALDLDHPLLDRATAAAGLLERLAQRAHVRFGERQALQERHPLAAAPLRFAVQVDRLLAGRQRRDGSRPALFTAQVTL